VEELNALLARFSVRTGVGVTVRGARIIVAASGAMIISNTNAKTLGVSRTFISVSAGILLRIKRLLFSRPEDFFG
jgi:hypothetical protein